MPPRSKIVNEDEVLRWFEEDRPYRWMVEQYLTKYHIETTERLWSSFRMRRGLKARYVQNDDLMPWGVRREHVHANLAFLLRTEARRRAGKDLRPAHLREVTSFVARLEREGLVVDYNPDHGFYLVPRKPDDNDIARKPQATTKRQARPR
jgi:hypothetical protein